MAISDEPKIKCSTITQELSGSEKITVKDLVSDLLGNVQGKGSSNGEDRCLYIKYPFISEKLE